ncbi:MAG: hypothetical protein ACTTHG_00390 [Treponemataceae bacterium]
MKKKLLVIALICALVFSLSGCLMTTALKTAKIVKDYTDNFSVSATYNSVTEKVTVSWTGFNSSKEVTLKGYKLVYECGLKSDTKDVSENTTTLFVDVSGAGVDTFKVTVVPIISLSVLGQNVDDIPLPPKEATCSIR